MRYILGLGNYAMGDDGIGLRVVEHIAEQDAEDGVGLVAIGNNGIQVLTYFTEETEILVIVDAVSFGGRTGDWTVFAPEDVETHKILGGISTHEGDILKLIELGKQLELHVPTIRIVAIEPGAMTLDTPLSPALSERFEEYVQAAIREVHA